MSATVTAAGHSERLPPPPATEPRAERTARRGETSPLNVPITAAFIGLLLMRDGNWAEASDAEPAADAPGGGPALPPGGARAPGGHNASGVGDGAQLALASRADATAAGGGEGALVQRLVHRGETTLIGNGDHVFQLGGEGRPIDVTLEGLQLNGMPLPFGPGGPPAAEPELVSEEATSFDGAGYLAQIEDVQLGTDGDDTLIGTDGNDYVSGGDGDDVIDGRGGDDTLHGDAGDDTVAGGDGHDNVYGDGGDDDLDGGGGSDIVVGGSGDDTLQGGDSADWGFDNLYGGFGSDSYTVNHISDVPDESWVADAGVDEFRVSSGFIDDFTGTKPYFTAADSFGQLPNDVAAGDHIHVSTGIENVFLDGGWDADIYGGGSANVLVGNAGANTIKGFAGDDVLDGRAGTNRLEGGRGADTYLIDTSLAGVDTIADGDGTSTLVFKGADFAELDVRTTEAGLRVELAGKLRAVVEGYAPTGPVVRIEADDGVFRVPGSNHAPTAAAEMADRTVAEDTTRSFSLPDNLFADVDPGETLVYSADRADGTALPDWLHFDAATARFTAAPGNADVGTVDVRVTATDSVGATASTSFLIGVENVNDAPTASVAAIFRPATEGTPFAWTLPANLFRDVDAGDTLRIDVEPSQLLDWLRYDGETRSFQGTPTNADVGTFDIAIDAVDDAGARAETTLTLDVANVNDAPRAGEIPSPDQIQRLVGDGTTYGYTLPARLFTDPDAGDTLSLRARLTDGSPLPDWLEFDKATAAFTGTPPDLDVDPFNVRITATDAAGATAEAVLRFDVSAYNRAPAVVEAPAGTLVAAEGRAFTWTLPEATFADEDGDLLSYALARAGGGAPPDWLTFDAATGAISGTPEVGDAGTFDLRLSAVDPSGAAAAIELTLAVEPNAAPQATAALDTWRVHEVNAGEPGHFLTLAENLFVDPDGHAVTLTASLLDGAALTDSFLGFDAETRQLFAAPAAGDVDPVTVRFTATDPFGASASVLLDVSVTPVNDAPVVAAAPVPLLAVEDEHYTWQVPTDTFFDEEGGPLTLTAAGADGGALPKWLEFHAPSASFEGTPGDGAAPRYDLVLTATDPDGATVSTTFTLYVDNSNDAPTVANPIATRTVRQGETLDFALAPDVFVDADGDALTVTAAPDGGGDLPSWLTFENGVFTGTPGNDDVGSLKLWVTAMDPAGEVAATAFHLNVQNVNDAPVAVDAYADVPMVVKEGETTTVDLSPDGHFTDADGDSLTLVVTQADGATLPSWLHFDPTTNLLTVTPNMVAAEQGAVSLGIIARDPSGRVSEDATTLDFEIVPVDPLIYGYDGKDVDTRYDMSLWPEPVEIPHELLLKSVYTFDEDVEGQQIQMHGRFETASDVQLMASLADGSALPHWLNFDPETGTFTGTPGNADVGDLDVRIRATDTAGHIDVENFRLTVDDTNDAPTVEGALATRTVAAGDGFSLTVPADLFADVDALHGDRLTLSVPEVQSLNWASFDPTTGVLSGVAPAVSTETDFTFTVRATDRAGEPVEAGLDLVVAPLNEAPAVAMTPDPPAAIEHQRYEWTMPTGAFDDPDGDALSYGARLSDGSALPDWLDFDATARVFSGTPGDADPGTLNVELTATDPAGFSARTVVALKINNVNDAPTVGVVADRTVAEDQPFALSLPADLFRDVDGDVLALSAPGLPGWLGFDAVRGELAGIAPNVAADTSHTVTLVGRDPAGLEATTSFTVEVTGDDDAPSATQSLASQSVAEDAAFSLTLPAELFLDPEGAAVDIAVDGPSWLTFADGTLRGSPADADVGTSTVVVTGTDPAGGISEVSFDLAVTNTNDAPTVAAPIADRTAGVGAAMTPVDVAAAFDDVDLAHGDALTFDVRLTGGSALPASLAFDGTTLAGSVATAGVYSLVAIATDGDGAQASNAFVLTVEAPVGTSDPLTLTDAGTMPASVLGGETTFTPSFYVSSKSGNLFYANGEPYWQHAEIDYMHLFNKQSFSEDDVVLDGDKRSDVLGNDADNVVLGNDGANIIVGQGGGDVLSGGGGDDELYGGAGDDVLAGGTGADRLVGAGGADRYEIGGLQDGMVDWIEDDAGANIVDLDGVTAAQMSFGMDGTDLVVAVNGLDAVRIGGFEAEASTFDVQTDDAAVSHAALLAAVEEMRAAYGAGERVALADVLDGYLGEAGGAAAGTDPLAAFLPAPGEGDGVDVAPVVVPAGVDDATATFVTPDGTAASTEAAAAGLAGKPASEEEPAFA